MTNKVHLLLFSFFVILIVLSCYNVDAAKKKKKKTPLDENKNSTLSEPPGYPAGCGDHLDGFTESCCNLVKQWWMDHIREEHLPGIYGNFIKTLAWDESSREGNGRCTATLHYEFRPVSLKSKTGCQETPYCTWINLPRHKACHCGREHLHIVKLLKSAYPPVFPTDE